MAISEATRNAFKTLRLSSMLEEYQRLCDDPGVKGWTVSEYLDQLFSHELKVRHARAIENRIKAADFPVLHRLEEYDFRRMPSLDESLVVELHDCEWIRRGDNVVYCGEHGLGKSHLGVSNGIEACERGLKVLYRKAEQLVLELLEARDEARVLKLRQKLMKVDLLIVDELGYTPFDRTGGELLHGVLSERYDARKSVLVTTNLTFARWVEVFHSKEMTIALLDRLTHRCDVIVMTGKSKRHEESLERQRARQAKRKEVTTT